MNNQNPNVYQFLTIYSQSERSTGGTRGYDRETYVETKLDKVLAPRIFDGSLQLVVLTGNAGDGKTAFIQRIEEKARREGAVVQRETDNGLDFELSGRRYQTLYDGSQDFEGAKNDAVLETFFREFEGNKPPSGYFVKIIAINEGKLRDFILARRKKYEWFGKQVHHYLTYEDFTPHESLVFVNLNLRSVIHDEQGAETIFDLILDRFLDRTDVARFWEDCKLDYCVYASRCYIKYNVDTLRDLVKGPQVRSRLKRLLLAVHFRKIRHVTMRDLRSILSLILFNKSTCEQLQNDLNAQRPLIERFYYNAVFNPNERDRIAQLLAEMDIATVSNPKLDSFINFHAPDSPEIQDLFVHAKDQVPTDLPYLKYLYERRPGGTQDNDAYRRENARLYHAAMRRKLFFESDEEKMRTAGLPTWKEMMPYRQFDRFGNVIRAGADIGNELADELTLAISKSERIYNETVGRENLCLRSTSTKRSPAKAFYVFPAADFKVIIKNIGAQAEYLEHLPSSIYYRHMKRADNAHTIKPIELEIPLDLFEILYRIHDGNIPTANEIRTFALNFEMFKRRVTSTRSDHILLTEDDTNLFEIKRSPSDRLVMTKLGG